MTDDAAAKLAGASFGAELVADPGGGQGAAVAAALADTDEPVLVVNADLPCAVPHDLRALLGATPEGGLALTPAADGTTNALSLAEPGLYAPLYGPGSAARFCEHAREPRPRRRAGADPEPRERRRHDGGPASPRSSGSGRARRRPWR